MYVLRIFDHAVQCIIESPLFWMLFSQMLNGHTSLKGSTYKIRQYLNRPPAHVLLSLKNAIRIFQLANQLRCSGFQRST